MRINSLLTESYTDYLSLLLHQICQMTFQVWRLFLKKKPINFNSQNIHLINAISLIQGLKAKYEIIF